MSSPGATKESTNSGSARGAALQLPPGPRGYPIVGILPRVWRDPLRFFQELSSECGGIARMGLGRFTLFLVSDPDLIRTVFQDRERIYWKGRGLAAAETVMGKGLATSEGELWERQHRLIQPAFTPSRLAPVVSTLAVPTAEMLERWQRRQGREARLDIAEEMHRLTQHMICRTLFGSDVNEAESEEICEAVAVANEFINHSAWQLVPVPEWLPTRRRVAFRRALRTLDAIVFRIIDERRRSGRERSDLLGHLLAARDEETGEGMSDRQLRDEIMTTFIAGHETPANGLAWTFYLLGQHTDVAERLRAEIDPVLSGDAAPSARDLEQLIFTEQVVRESMRLYPPAWVVVRTPKCDTTLGGYDVPAATPLLLSQYVVHRHPDIWDRPETFDPDRWPPVGPGPPHRFAYFPFGGGIRLCTGHILAMLMMKLVVGMVLRDRTIELVPNQSVTPHPLTTLRPRPGVRVVARARR